MIASNNNANLISCRSSDRPAPVLFNACLYCKHWFYPPPFNKNVWGLPCRVNIWLYLWVTHADQITRSSLLLSVFQTCAHFNTFSWCLRASIAFNISTTLCSSVHYFPPRASGLSPEKASLLICTFSKCVLAAKALLIWLLCPAKFRLLWNWLVNKDGLREIRFTFVWIVGSVLALVLIFSPDFLVSCKLLNIWKDLTRF